MNANVRSTCARVAAAFALLVAFAGAAMFAPRIEVVRDGGGAFVARATRNAVAALVAGGNELRIAEPAKLQAMRSAVRRNGDEPGRAHIPVAALPAAASDPVVTAARAGTTLEAPLVAAMLPSAHARSNHRSRAPPSV